MDSYVIQGELSPCPFCRKCNLRGQHMRSIGHWIGCRDCGALGPSGRTAQEALDKWQNGIGRGKTKRTFVGSLIFGG